MFAVIAASLFQARARAQDDATRAMARQLGAEGLEAFQANEFAAAELKLDRAFRLYATPTLGLWSARAREKAGHWVEAAERMREAMRASADAGDTATQRAAQRDAELELNALLPRIPSLTLELRNAELAETSVTLDGIALPREAIGLARPTNPGKHALVAVSGGERVESTLQLAEAEHKQLPLVFQAARVATSAEPVAAPQLAAASPQPMSDNANSASVLRPISYVAMGVGIAGLATGVVAMLLANSNRAGCTDENGALFCATDSQTDKYNSYRTISTVGVYAGGALLVGGLVMWLVAPSVEARPSSGLSFSVGPGELALSGRF
jgi:hypothetical protein